MRKSIVKFINNLKNMGLKGSLDYLTDLLLSVFDMDAHIKKVFGRFNVFQLSFIFGMIMFGLCLHFLGLWFVNTFYFKEVDIFNFIVTLIMFAIILKFLLMLEVEDDRDPKGKEPIPDEEEETEFDIGSEESKQPDNVIKFKKAG